MILGRISGSIYSTINHDFYNGKKILIIDKISPDGKNTGNYLFAVDTVGAGAGETVLIIDEGNSARQILNSPDGPVRSVIVGIVDEVNVGDRYSEPGS